MLPIIFGYPMAELVEAAKRGEVALGGCVVSSEDPTHHCSACGQDVILDADGPLTFAACGHHVILVVDGPLTCAACGRPLLDDPEDDPVGEAGRPICGDCNRAGSFAAIEEPAWIADESDDA